MNKRGNERKIIFLTSMMMAALIVGLLMFRAVSNFLDDTTYWRLYYSRDLGLLMDMGQAGRGIIELNYELVNSAKPLVFRLTENAVGLYDYNPKINNPIPTSFRFARDSKIIIEPNEVFSSYVKIYFSESKTRISEEPLKEEICPEIDTTADPTQTSIFVKSDTPIFEALVKNELAEFNIVDSEKNADLTIILQKSDDEGLNFYYHKSARRSEKLSCLMKNSILQDDSITIKVTSLQNIAQDSQWFETLENSKLGLVVEVKEPSNDLLKLIAEGVKNYYG
ncbi:hypothetical protein HQ533_01435 [Candidatus Woesearchaeota archaeon]|nr:hypothetical protein [Candidatus Woesearchaeota archaeon]